MAVTEHPGATPAAVAAHIAGVLRNALATRGQASLAVSGGKSPVELFQALRAQLLDWSQVWITLVDERVVPHGHADSNTALVLRHLLQDQTAAARFVPFFDHPPAAHDAQALDALTRQASARLAPIPWPLDVVVLGMGADGHTASLFAGANGYAHAIATHERLAWVVPATAPHARISLSLHALCAARACVLPLSGSKIPIYRQAAERTDAALPVSLVLGAAHTPVSVWLG